MSVYAVVFEGVSGLEPMAGTAPTPWSIVTLAAACTDQFKVADPPALISGGVTLSTEIDGGSVRQDRPPTINAIRLHRKKRVNLNLRFIVSTERFG